MSDLGTTTKAGLVEPITSNEYPTCLQCGCRITSSNDSGWERFCSDGRTTQPVCKSCDAKPITGEKVFER